MIAVAVAATVVVAVAAPAPAPAVTPAPVASMPTSRTPTPTATLWPATPRNLTTPSEKPGAATGAAAAPAKSKMFTTERAKTDGRSSVMPDGASVVVKWLDDSPSSQFDPERQPDSGTLYNLVGELAPHRVAQNPSGADKGDHRRQNGLPSRLTE